MSGKELLKKSSEELATEAIEEFMCMKEMNKYR